MNSAISFESVHSPAGSVIANYMDNSACDGQISCCIPCHSEGLSIRRQTDCKPAGAGEQLAE
jgi:hypothetical protein